ncbi:MAG: metallophosphoesterase [Pirellulales bacterium]
MYDIIGDIHGHADRLVRLLEIMGYSNSGGTWRHPESTAVFVGDLIDRGPQIREVVDLVRRMCDAGAAKIVMGNHEFNALTYHTPNPAKPGAFLRERSTRTTKQIAATLEQFNPNQLEDALHWFRSLPFYVELDGIRVVHACWNREQIAMLDTARRDCGGVNTDFLVRATQRNEPLYEAIEIVLKGPEIQLPQGYSYSDRYGTQRRTMRIRWYRPPDEMNETYQSYALTVDQGLPTDRFPSTRIPPHFAYPDDAPPVFFGHYWLRGERPGRLATNVACLDYSVALGGYLCAYRWRGERTIDDSQFALA